MILTLKLRQSGFTLLELLATILIAGILFSTAIPSFRNLIQNNRQVSHTNEFVTSMHLARSEAVKRGRVVRVTAANASDSSDEWAPGWSVWVDLNSSNTMNAGEELRGVIDMTDSITLNSTGDVSDYRYNPDGSLGAGANDTLDVCDSSRSGEVRRRISTSANGRVSLDTSGTCP
jgi:type IV fimbrial biogenesis protein FimT